MIISQYQIERIKWRLINDGAANLSNEEIERILSKTCSPIPLINAAKELRDKGLLNLKTNQDNQLSLF
jgi:DNA repair protein RadC